MAADWQELYPFESQEIEIDGHRYHYLDEGSGPPLVCVHGNPTWSFYWRNLVLALRNEYRVIAVDHIGCGLSDKPAGYRYRLSQHVENLKQLVSSLELENTTLIAHDWGGPIGLGALMNVPHRFCRVVLLNTGAYPPDNVPLILRVARSPVFGQLAVQGMNRFILSAFKTATKMPDGFSQPVKAGYLHPYSNWSDRKAIYAFVRDIPTSQNHPTWNVLKHIENGLPKLADMPVQMIWGMQDWCFSPEVLAHMRQLLPNASVHEIASAGHFVMEDAQHEVIDVIDEFLQSTAESCQSQ